VDQATHNKIVSFIWSIDILAIEKEAEGLLDGSLKVGAKP